MDSVGEREGGKIWENGIETCEMSCMKRDASPGSMHDAGCLGLVHWDDPEAAWRPTAPGAWTARQSDAARGKTLLSPSGGSHTRGPLTRHPPRCGRAPRH